jgi:hypothetical protein
MSTILEINKETYILLSGRLLPLAGFWLPWSALSFFAKSPLLFVFWGYILVKLLLENLEFLRRNLFPMTDALLDGLMDPLELQTSIVTHIGYSETGRKADKPETLADDDPFFIGLPRHGGSGLEFRW